MEDQGSGVQSRTQNRRVVHLNDLPDEIFEHIFSFLNFKERFRTEQVCRRWRELGRTVQWNWPTELKLSYLKICREPPPTEAFGHFKVDVETFSSVLSRCGRALKCLDMIVPLVSAGEVLDIVANNCPNLEEIIFEEGSYRNEFHRLVNLIEKCQKLKKVRWDYVKSTDATFFSDFLQNFHNLECLTVSRNMNITFICNDDVVYGECLFSATKQLKRLFLNNYETKCVDVFVNKVTTHFDNLEGFGLSWPIDDNGYEFVDDIEDDDYDNYDVLSLSVVMKVLCSYEKTLTILYLEGCRLCPNEWCQLPKVLQHVEVLSVACSVGVNDKFIKLLSKKCTKLKTLNVTSCQSVSDDGLSALARALSLKELHTDITGIGVQIVVTQGRLERFYLAPGNAQYLVQETCILLAACCPNFRCLNVNDNPFVTNELVKQFRLSLQSGFLKGPVLLHVAGTRVTKNVKCCYGMTLKFDHGAPVFYL